MKSESTEIGRCEKHGWQNAFPGQNICPYCETPAEGAIVTRCLIAAGYVRAKSMILRAALSDGREVRDIITP